MIRILKSLIFLWIIYLSSCTIKDKSSSNKKTILTEVKQYSFEVDSAWKSMLQSDDIKISNILRLIEELKLIDGTSEIKLKSLTEEANNLKAIRYNIESIRNSKLIDKYDSVTNKVFFETKEEINKNPNAEKYQIISQLVSEIQMADDSVIIYRKNYDKKVDNFNSFKKKNIKKLNDLKSGESQIPEYSLFRLIP